MVHPSKDLAIWMILLIGKEDWQMETTNIYIMPYHLVVAYWRSKFRITKIPTQSICGNGAT